MVKTTSPAPKQPKKPLDVEALEPVKRWNVSSIVWGSLLILVGVLLLMDNLGVISLDYTNIWRLWPVLIIAAGVSFLSLRGWLGGLIAAVLIVFILVLTSFVILKDNGPVVDDNKTVKNVDISRSSEDITKASVSIDAGAGEINIDSDRNVNLVESSLESNFADLKYSSSMNNSIQNINLSVEGDSGWWNGDYVNNLSVILGTDLPYELTLDSGASRIRADLSKVKLEALEVKSGASDIEMKLGDRVSRLAMTLDLGVSSAVLRFPKNVGILLNLDSGLSGVTIDGLSEIEENVYRSDNYEMAEKKIEINGKIGVTSLRIEYY